MVWRSGRGKGPRFGAAPQASRADWVGPCLTTKSDHALQCIEMLPYPTEAHPLGACTHQQPPFASGMLHLSDTDAPWPGLQSQVPGVHLLDVSGWLVRGSQRVQLEPTCLHFAHIQTNCARTCRRTARLTCSHLAPACSCTCRTGWSLGLPCKRNCRRTCGWQEGEGCICAR